MTRPLISIITPVYNEERHLRQMIESVLAQTYTNWELVLVDDGSTDDTVHIAKSYADDDSRVHLISCGHVGLVGAFNLAFDASVGDVILHCGGDDYMTPDSLSSRANAFQRFPADARVATFSKIRMFWDDGSQKARVVPRGRNGSRSSPGYAMTRALAEVVFPIPSDLVADDPWVGLVLATQAEYIEHLAAVSVNYRVHAGNMNPRHKPFHEQSESLFTHAQALRRLLDTDRFHLSAEDRRDLAALWMAEQRCHERRPLGVLRTRGISMSDRLALTAAASPTLTRIRTRFYGQLSGWRGR